MLPLFLLAETFPETTSAASAAFTDAPGVDFTWLFLKMVFALAVVCLAAFGVIKYLLPRSSYVRKSAQSSIQILERFGIEPKKNLYIIQVGKRKFLLGSTEHSITQLLELESKDNYESSEE